MDPAYEAERRAMVETQLRARGIEDARVLAAMAAVPRHRFVPAGAEALAYEDSPLAIGHGQTISQPYIVAYMTAALRLPPSAKVLEIGTGSGYQAAVLAELAAEVYTIETVPELAARARQVLAEAGYGAVHVREGDGYGGWPDEAPFDGIIVTAAPDHVPPAFLEQLGPRGRLVVPVGAEAQELLVLVRTPEGVREEARLAVRFVPLTRRPPAR